MIPINLSPPAPRSGSAPLTGEASSPQGLLISDDLIFQSKILGTAQALGYQIAKAVRPDQALEAIERWRPKLVLIDLASSLATRDNLEKYRKAVGSWGSILAFGPHVEVEKLKAATEVGCNLVMPRSKFAARLPDWLHEAFNSKTP